MYNLGIILLIPKTSFLHYACIEHHQIAKSFCVMKIFLKYLKRILALYVHSYIAVYLEIKNVLKEVLTKFNEIIPTDKTKL